MRGLWHKGGKFCFSRRIGVRCVEAMFHALDFVLENFLAILMHLAEYIYNKADLGRREKAEGLLDAFSHPPFKFMAAFFCALFAVVCATSKKNQGTRGARVAAFQGLMKVMCPQLLHSMCHVIPGGSEESLGVETRSNWEKGSRVRWKIVVCLGLLRSRSCKFLSKRIHTHKFI